MRYEMTEQDYEYIGRLRRAYEAIIDPYEREVFWYVCKAFQEYKFGRRELKRVSKAELLRHLILKGYHMYGKSGELPDARKLRDAARNLLYRGLPVVATSKAEGYYIAQNNDEIDAPQAENTSRGKHILMANRGYERARQFVMGQASMFDEVEEL